MVRLVAALALLAPLAGPTELAAAEQSVARAAARGAAGALISAARARAVSGTRQGRAFALRQASLELQLGLTFAEAGEDWRAISALKRYRALDGGRDAAHLGALLEGELLARNGRAERAAAAYEESVIAAPEASAKAWSFLLASQQSCAVLDRWTECAWRLADLEDSLGPHLEPELAELVRYERVFAELVARRSVDPAPFSTPELARHHAALLEAPEAFAALDLPSPGAAGALSALIPGAGQIYNGRWGDAAIALTLTGASAAWAVWSFTSGDSPASGVAASLLFVGFYAGNITNAYVDATRRRAQAYDRFFTDLKASHWPRARVRIRGESISFDYRFDWGS